jgi:uncharacterized protein YuzE
MPSDPMQQEDRYLIEIDEEADAAYVRVTDAPIARTDELADGIIVDFDANDEMVGIEVLGLGDRVGTGDKASYLNGLVAGLRIRPTTAAAE